MVMDWGKGHILHRGKSRGKVGAGMSVWHVNIERDLPDSQEGFPSFIQLTCLRAHVQVW